MKYFLKYFLSLTLTCCVFGSVLTSCSDEVVIPENSGDKEENGEFKDVYTLNFVATVDNLGSRGVYSNSDDPWEITRWENYIDLERFRVLFFGEDDKFLFESKNRWVKQLDASDNFSSWYISVPLGAFGNDSYGEGEEYDWDAIRDYVTNHQFKIALLVNRPAQLLYPGFMDSELSLNDGVFDNDGPYWTPKDAGEKKLFDLQHYQYDIIYTDKGEHRIKNNNSFYDFVMDDIDTDRPKMGAAINWVSFDNGDTDKELLSGTNYMRNIKMPSANHPIPMYGVQIFDKIPAEFWKKGTPFDISNLPKEAYPDVNYTYRSISLLRCCVRLDLKIPKSVKNGSKPVHLSLWYSNIYSRTEPMDNWTPTDQIWNQYGKDHSDGNCEMSRLIEYGPVVTNKDPGNGTTKAKYQERLKWFYGAWLDKDWEFKTVSGGSSVPEKKGIEYPRIFNACIQRNKVIRINNGDVTDLYPDRNQYWHYIVYTGERSPNDVNTLPNMPANPYIACFVISWDNTNFYCIPLLNYGAISYDYYSAVFGPDNSGAWKNASPSSAYNTFLTTVTQNTGEKIPYPLLRNHIYRFTLKGSRSGGADDDGLKGIHLESEVRSTPDINYSEKVKQLTIDKGIHITTEGENIMK